MCLTITRNAKLRTATKDIKVYKVVTMKNEGLYHRSFVYTPNALHRLRKPLKRIYEGIFCKYEVERGFHSFPYKADAVGECRGFLFGYVKVVEMIIPKGAKYYVGQYDNNTCYVSTSIKTGDLENIRNENENQK